MRKIIITKDNSVDLTQTTNITIGSIPIVTKQQTILTPEKSHDVMSLIDNGVNALDFPNIERRADGLHAFTVGENSVLTSDEIVSKLEKITTMDGTEEFNMPKTTKFTIAGEEVIRGNIYPVGSTYTQYPHETLGLFVVAENPANLFGGTWIKLFANESTFFRTEGLLANVGRNDGIQMDGIKSHQHDTVLGSHSHGLPVTQLESMDLFPPAGGGGGITTRGSVDSTNLGTKRSEPNIYYKNEN